MPKHVYILYALLSLPICWSAQAETPIWNDVTAVQIGARSTAQARFFEADDTALRNALSYAPHETAALGGYRIRLPMPDGSLALFSVAESPIMAPGLAAKNPGIKTFRVVGVDDKNARGRIDITPTGFHGMIQTAAGRVMIDPRDFRVQDHIYRSQFSANQARRAFNCGVHDGPAVAGHSAITGLKTAHRISGSLLRYDLAVAVTFEYHQFFGNDVSLTTNRIATTINCVNFIYERDHGIRLMLVADNEDIYETSDSGLLDNEDEFALLGQVNDWIDSNLPGGDAGYDIGHIFSRPAFIGGGVANIGAVCNADFKAGGVSGLPNPSGDAFDVDLVAHEIGHQFGATHSFNGTTSACTNRSAASAYEPGSGSSIMGYAGICAAENLQTNSDASFHAGSIAQIDSFTVGAGNCYTQIATTTAGNNDPVMTAIANASIPANTPFLLEGTATDPDLDPLDYRWDQMNTGCATDAASFGTDNGSNALFRSHLPRTEARRNFPALGTQLLGRFDDAEVLPCQNRRLDFRLTATDGRSGQDFEDVQISVVKSAGPFEITNVATPIFAGTPFAVDWSVAGTNQAPIDCAEVDIDLIALAPGNASYSVYPLLHDTANDGTAVVTLSPATRTHPRTRVRVKCSNNVFYDISDADIGITQGIGPPVVLDDTAFITRSYANIATTDSTPPVCGAVVDCSPPPADSDSGGGKDASAIDVIWLLMLGGLAAICRCGRRQG